MIIKYDNINPESVASLKQLIIEKYKLCSTKVSVLFDDEYYFIFKNREKALYVSYKDDISDDVNKLIEEANNIALIRRQLYKK